MPSVYFFQGDIFEQRSDMVVLPCSAKAHTSGSAQRHIDRFDLPLPTSKELGEIEVLRFPGSGNYTRYIAWAASVMDYTSTAEIIHKNGENIGRYANKMDGKIHLIESPLLGTGSGGLNPIDAGLALSEGFLATCKTDAILHIYCQVTDVIRTLRTKSGSKGRTKFKLPDPDEPIIETMAKKNVSETNFEQPLQRVDNQQNIGGNQITNNIYNVEKKRKKIKNRKK